MIELFALVCLAAAPETCAERLVPAPPPCAPSHAPAWAARHPELILKEARCAELSGAVAPLTVEEVVPGVFVHAGRVALADPANDGDIATIGFVIGENAVAVIDAGGSRAVAEGLYAAIRARTSLPIGWLVLTHMHPDHTLGAELFAEAGATILAHERLAAALANRAASYRATLGREAGAAAAIATKAASPDAAVEERRELDLGGRVLLVEAHPTAHTDNDLTVLDIATGTWFLGDLVFDRHLPVVDGSALGWIALLDRLDARPAARIVPGHGGPTLPWPEGAAPTRAYLEALVAQTRAALAAGESLSAAARHLGDGLRDGWSLFDAFNTRNATAVYRELEWE